MLQHANSELEQQIAMLERGFAITNKDIHKEQEEMHRKDISQLERSLQATLEEKELLVR